MCKKCVNRLIKGEDRIVPEDEDEDGISHFGCKQTTFKDLIEFLRCMKRLTDKKEKRFKNKIQDILKSKDNKMFRRDIDTHLRNLQGDIEQKERIENERYETLAE